MLYRTYTAFGQDPEGITTKFSVAETDFPNSIVVRVGGEVIILTKTDWLELIRRTGEYSYSDFAWADEPTMPADPTTEV